jgi:hypothetical protein
MAKYLEIMGPEGHKTFKFGDGDVRLSPEEKTKGFRIVSDEEARKLFAEQVGPGVLVATRNLDGSEKTVLTNPTFDKLQDESLIVPQRVGG